MKQADVKFQSENEDRAYSPMGGAVLIEELCKRFGICRAIDEHIEARRAGNGIKYTDSDYVKSFMLMQILGGDTVDDLKMLRDDPVIQAVMGKIPGRTSLHNYLASFIDRDEEAKRGQGESTVLVPNRHLKGFDEVTRHILSVVPSFQKIHTVTLDQDATFIPTKVNGALYNYKSERSFEALGTYCPEYDMTIRSEYRDGNVTPGYRQLENLVESLRLLPDSVEKVRLRSDTAGYQIDLLKYCACGKNERFGVIEFAVGCPVTSALKETVRIPKENEWHSIPKTSGHECAVIPFAPNSLSSSKNGPEYRFIAIREPLSGVGHVETAQGLLFTDEDDSRFESLHPMSMNGKVYKIFALVTGDILTPPEEIVSWYRGRCGKSEEVHRILKSELAGGHVVTSALGANAAWWQIAVLSANILSLVKTFCLPGSYRSCRPKKLRFYLFSAVARISRHARKRIAVIYNSFSARLLRAAWNKLIRFRLQTE